MILHRGSTLRSLLPADNQLCRLVAVRGGSGQRARARYRRRSAGRAGAFGPKEQGRVFSIQGESMSQAFERACEPHRANISGVRFHDLRHEATSRLFEKGLNFMEVAAITGYKTLDMLKRYTHLRAEDLAKKLG